MDEQRPKTKPIAALQPTKCEACGRLSEYRTAPRFRFMLEPIARAILAEKELAEKIDELRAAEEREARLRAAIMEYDRVCRQAAEGWSGGDFTTVSGLDIEEAHRVMVALAAAVPARQEAVSTQSEADREAARSSGSWTTCRVCGYDTEAFNGATNHAEDCTPCTCWLWPSDLFETPVNGHHPKCLDRHEAE